MSVIVAVMAHKDYGMPCQQCIDSVRSPTRISGRLTRRYSQTRGIKVLARIVALTSLIERFNCTLRQRVSPRLVSKTLSFSKKLENHIGAIWYFVHHYNASLLI